MQATTQGSYIHESRISVAPHQPQSQSHLAEIKERPATYSRLQLQTLVRRYHFLDQISLMKPDMMMSHIDSFFIEPHTRSMKNDLVSVRTTTPRSWLTMRRVLRGCHTRVLRVILDVLQDALLNTNDILNGEPDEYALTAGERKLIEAPFDDCVNARKLVMVFLRDEVRALLNGVAILNSQATHRMEPRILNMRSCKSVICLKEDVSPAGRQRSTPHDFARIAQACTVFQPRIFGELIQFKGPRTD